MTLALMHPATGELQIGPASGRPTAGLLAPVCIAAGMQLHDLTGRPGVDVRRNAFADLVAQGPPHPPASLRDEQHRRRAKQNPSRRCCACHDRFPARRDLRPVRLPLAGIGAFAGSDASRVNTSVRSDVVDLSARGADVHQLRVA
jgi:hypothetical protein